MKITLEFDNIGELVTALQIDHAMIASVLGVSPSLAGKKLRGVRPFYAREVDLIHELVTDRGAIISRRRMDRLIKLRGRIEPKPLWSRRDETLTGGTVTGGGSNEPEQTAAEQPAI